nr:CotH kinase family protein [Spirochaetales bacterium]
MERVLPWKLFLQLFLYIACLTILLIMTAGCVHREPVDYTALIEERNVFFQTVEKPSPLSVVINEVSIRNGTQFQALDGSYPRWMELSNRTDQTVSIHGWRIRITDKGGSVVKFAPFPDIQMSPGSYRLFVFVPESVRVPVSAVRLAATLPETAKTVDLLDVQSQVVDRFEIPKWEQKPFSEVPVRDVSASRDPILPSSIRISGRPTPGLINTAVIDVPRFVNASGFYDKAVISFNTDRLPEGYQIRYTINDGIEYVNDKPTDERSWVYPTLVDGRRFERPVELAKTAVVKARVYAPSGACSSQETRVYFVGESTSLPVVSLTVDPADLWDNELGIYTAGASPELPNYFIKAVRKGRLEYFTTTQAQKPDISDEYLIRLFGGSSRDNASKSIAVYAKKPASTNRIPNMFFTGSAAEIDDFYSVILRNSGEDFPRTMMRDVLMTGIASGSNLKLQDAQPAVAFINGQYWGILNIREKINEYFLADHTSSSPGNFDFVEGSYGDVLSVNEGTPAYLETILDLLEVANASFDSVYQNYVRLLDIENFIDYVVFQSFFNNTNWPWSNVKGWRDRAGDGKWNFILFDTDAGFDTTEFWTQFNTSLEKPVGRVDFDMIGYLAGGGESDLVSRIFRVLIQNETFFDRFIARYRELLAATLSTENMLLHIADHVSAIEDEI